MCEPEIPGTPFFTPVAHECLANTPDISARVSLPVPERFCIPALMMVQKVFRNIAIIAFLWAPMAHSALPDSAAGEKQYIAVNIIPGEQYRPIFEEIARIASEKHADRVRMGIGAIFSYFNQPEEKTVGDLTEFLSLSRQYGIPVVVQLDGESWWENRPDLWNWWDPARPGYDTANRRNVEWYGWGPEDALKIAWRNWGRQLRVLPPPNLMSPRYRKACHDEMRVLIPIVLRWWSDLPEKDKLLFIGMKLGWESSIGVNAFYIPNGNGRLDRPESDDPQVEVLGERVPDRGLTTIGYAAVSTAGLATSGMLKEADLTEIIRRHLEDLCQLASRLGMPRDKLFTHEGGWKEGELLYDAALNQYSCPGWSFYRHAGDASKDIGVQRVLAKSDAPYWAAVEWMLMGDHTERDWRVALTRTLAIPRCRYLCVYNWSGIRNNPAAVDAIKSCLR